MTWGLFSIGARAGWTSDEPFPALIGPHFGKVLWSGSSVLVENVAIQATLESGEVNIPVQKLTQQFPVPSRFVVRRWMMERPFSTKAGRVWLKKKLKKLKAAQATNIAFQWTERPFDPKTRQWTGPRRVVQEEVFPL